LIPSNPRCPDRRRLSRPARRASTPPPRRTSPRVLDSIVTGLNQSVASLQKVTPPSDFKAFNASIITAFQNTTKQVTDAKTALAAGDISKADALFSGSGTFGDEFSNIDKQYPALSARLDACPSPTP